MITISVVSMLVFSYMLLVLGVFIGIVIAGLAVMAKEDKEKMGKK